MANKWRRVWKPGGLLCSCDVYVVDCEPISHPSARIGQICKGPSIEPWLTPRLPYPVSHFAKNNPACLSDSLLSLQICSRIFPPLSRTQFLTCVFWLVWNIRSSQNARKRIPPSLSNNNNEKKSSIDYEVCFFFFIELIIVVALEFPCPYHLIAATRNFWIQNSMVLVVLEECGTREKFSRRKQATTEGWI